MLATQQTSADRQRELERRGGHHTVEEVEVTDRVAVEGRLEHLDRGVVAVAVHHERHRGRRGIRPKIATSRATVQDTSLSSEAVGMSSRIASGTRGPAGPACSTSDRSPAARADRSSMLLRPVHSRPAGGGGNVPAALAAAPAAIAGIRAGEVAGTGARAAGLGRTGGGRTGGLGARALAGNGTRSSSVKRFPAGARARTGGPPGTRTGRPRATHLAACATGARRTVGRLPHGARASS